MEISNGPKANEVSIPEPNTPRSDLSNPVVPEMKSGGGDYSKYLNGGVALAVLSAAAYGHFQKPLNLKPEFGRSILEGAVRVNA